MAGLVDRLEGAYLGAIRGLALLGATLPVLVALWLAISGAYKAAQDTASVEVVPAVVSAEDVPRIDTGQLTEARSGSRPIH